MDCNMPVMDGFQATKAIRSYLRKQNAQQPYIVALTAYNTEWFKRKCYESEMDYFLSKPLEVPKLHKILQ